MITDDMKKANVQAMKDKNTNARNIFGVVKNKIMLEAINIKKKYEDMTDEEVVPILLKCVKELTEEAESYRKAGKADTAANIEEQKNIVSSFLPEMMSKDRIKEIIESLPDKSVPFVMKHFKANYNGKCDMSDVSAVLKEING